MSFVDFAELKARTTMADAVAKLGLTIAQKGNQWRGACSNCKTGGDRALVITEGKGFYCFSAKKGGDQIALIAHVRGVSVKEAAQLLAGTVPVPPKAGTVPVTGTVPESEGGKETQKLQPLPYLLAEHESVQALGVSKATAEHFGAGYAPRGIMRGRLAIPLFSPKGELLAYCGRAVKDESPTLKFPNGFEPGLFIYGADRVTGGELYLTRDPLQVLTAFEQGIENVVSFLTETVSSAQLELLASLMDGKGCTSVELFL